MHRHPFLTRQRGVSLVEVMITAAIAAVTVGTVLPDFSRMQQRHRLDGVAGQLESEMQFARSMAVADRRRPELLRHPHRGPRRLPVRRRDSRVHGRGRRDTQRRLHRQRGPAGDLEFGLLHVRPRQGHREPDRHRDARQCQGRRRQARGQRDGQGARLLAVGIDRPQTLLTTPLKPGALRQAASQLRQAAAPHLATSAVRVNNQLL